MTKEELDRQIVEKKLAELNVAEGAALLKFNAQNIAIPETLGETAEKFLKMNLAKKTKIPGVLSPRCGYFLKLTHFGLMVKGKLVKTEPKCPF